MSVIYSISSGIKDMMRESQCLYLSGLSQMFWGCFELLASRFSNLLPEWLKVSFLKGKYLLNHSHMRFYIAQKGPPLCLVVAVILIHVDINCINFWLLCIPKCLHIIFCILCTGEYHPYHCQIRCNLKEWTGKVQNQDHERVGEQWCPDLPVSHRRWDCGRDQLNHECKELNAEHHSFVFIPVVT